MVAVMGFKCGLVGMPNVGKSSIFNLLTSQKIDAKNFPFCTIDPNIATVEVPDERLDKLSILNSSKSKVNAVIEFVDIAGLIKGASKGEGLGNDFLTHIKNTDAIAHVVRFFIDDDIIHVNGKPNPDSDFSDINSELMLSDIATLESILNRITKSKNSDKEKNILKDEVSNALDKLNNSNFLDKTDLEKVKEFFPDIKMLTQKPMFVIANVNENTSKKEIEKFKGNLPKDITVVEVDVKTETDLNELSNEEKTEFMKEFNITESALSKIIKTGYSLLDLKTFLHLVKKNQELGQQKSISMLMNVQVLYILISKKGLSGLRQFLTMTISKVEVSKPQKLMVYGDKRVKIILSPKAM